MDRDEGRREFDHGADAAGHRVGNVVQLEIEEEAHAGRADRHREGVAHTRRAMGQEEFEAELDATDGRLRPTGDALDQPGGMRKIGGVDAAVDGIGAGLHGGRNLMATPPTSNREFSAAQPLRTRRTASFQPA